MGGGSRIADMGRHASAHVLSVDAARGLLACSILAYHLLAWEKFGRVWAVGYYGVYGFFVISGFSLYLAYRDRLRSPADVAAYLLKRFWRIAPLFYVVCAARLLFVSVPEDAWSRLLLNLTLVFGFADPGATSLIVGGWSIGIELVFYVLFIPLIWMARGRTLALALITLASVALMINHADRTAGDWVAYTQPAAFFGYFAAGCLVAELYLRHSARLKGRAVFILLAAAALIPFALARPETARDILVGGTGGTLMACTIGLITATAFISEPSGRLRQPAYWLGRLSYPIYLYNPSSTGRWRSPRWEGRACAFRSPSP